MKIIIIIILLSSFSCEAMGQMDTVVCFDGLGVCYNALMLNKWQKRKINSFTYINIFLKKINGDAKVEFFEKGIKDTYY